MLFQKSERKVRFGQLATLGKILTLASAFMGTPVFLTPADAQSLAPNKAIENLTAQDIQEALIALTAFAEDPGISGTRINVNQGPGQPELQYSKGDFLLAEDFWLPGRNLAIYGEIGFSTLDVNDRFNALNVTGQTVEFKADRQVTTGRVGLGVTTNVFQHVSFTPFVSVALSRLETRASITNNVSPATLPPALFAAFVNWKTDAVSTAITLNVKYDRFWGQEEERVEAKFNYTFAYHDSFNEDFNFLKFSGTTDTINLLLRYSQPLGFTLFNRPLRWNVLTEVSAFPTLEKDDLGFQYYLQLGGGIDWQLNFDVFGYRAFRYIGFSVGGIVGGEVIGAILGLSIRN